MRSASILHANRVFCGLLGIVTCLLTLPALAREPKAPGLHDLVIYTPGTHERGLPSVRFRTSPDGTGLDVEITPTVHIHRYYYSGDKEIQGPIIQGGPTVVVAKHPKTGEQMYIDVMLPAGTPKIAYNKHSITYVYPDRRVGINFSRLPFCSERVIVRHCSGQGVGRTVYEFREKAGEQAKQNLSESSVVQSLKETTSGAGKLVSGLKESAGSLTSQVLDGAKSVVGMIPGMSSLRSMAEEGPQKKYLNSVQQAARRAERSAPKFLPTNR